MYRRNTLEERNGAWEKPVKRHGKITKRTYFGTHGYGVKQYVQVYSQGCMDLMLKRMGLPFEYLDGRLVDQNDFLN